jgi:hypothetical protein
MSPDAEYRSAVSLESQLAMNGQTWQTLQEHGATEESELRLDFVYFAPGEQEANELAAFLRAETDYEVQVDSSTSGLLRRRAWTVSGTTQKTQLTLDVLDTWVEWMVAAGTENGQCEFDGWGAEVP